VNDTVKDNGLGDFFPPGDTYPEEVAKKAAELKNDPNNPLKSPEQLKDLATLALYQPVIYCGRFTSSLGQDDADCHQTTADR
jgi:hypothetical protein